MRVLTTIFLMTFSMSLFSQEHLNDLDYWKTNEGITLSWGDNFEWSIVEVWGMGKTIHVSKAIQKGKRGRYFIPNSLLDGQQWKTVSIFVTRNHNGIVFRNNVMIPIQGKRHVELRTPPQNK